MTRDVALDTYITESRELLDDMEAALLGLETEEGSCQDRLNSLFRSVHTIKGSAGLFGLDAIVRFTHEVETCLDRLRLGELEISESLISLMLKCQEHIAHLVELADQEQDELDAMTEREHQQLLAQVRQLLESADELEDGIEGTLQQAVLADHWHLSLRFRSTCLQEGMDPLSFLRYLQTLGTLVNLVTLDAALPADPADFDPETCYLGFELALKTQASKQQLEAVFEFVHEDSQIRILPPYSQVQEYLKLIESMPEGQYRLGEILVQCQSLTPNELQLALNHQQLLKSQPEPVERKLGEILVEQGSVIPQLVEAAAEKQLQSKDKGNREQNSIRVDAQRLDGLINLIGELVTAGASTALYAGHTQNAQLAEAVSNLTELVEGVRDAALQLRMVQIGATFNRFRRVVRDISRELGKQVELVITGAETELDKTIVERIGDPLMHLVRNAMDHGLESAGERQQLGKPESGRLQLNAFHDSGSIVIEVRDDGRGLDAGKIRAKAISKGLITADQVLDDSEVYNLIFAPGLSTAESISNLSGRGVGMDVVHSNITELGGRVEVESQTGRGSTIRIHLPLTLAIIDGFQVSVGSSAFVIPLDSVLECVELNPAHTSQQQQRKYINLRGEALPYIRLRDLFQLGGAPARRENVVVVRYGAFKAGLVVDQLEGELQTVIKPLGRLFSHLQGIGGSTIMGNGSVALILDIPNLVQRVTAAESRAVTY